MKTLCDELHVQTERSNSRSQLSQEQWHAARRQELALLAAVICSSGQSWSITPEDCLDRAEAILKLSYERYYGK